MVKNYSKWSETVRSIQWSKMVHGFPHQKCQKGTFLSDMSLLGPVIKPMPIVINSRSKIPFHTPTRQGYVNRLTFKLKKSFLKLLLNWIFVTCKLNPLTSHGYVRYHLQFQFFRKIIYAMCSQKASNRWQYFAPIRGIIFSHSRNVF